MKNYRKEEQMPNLDNERVLKFLDAWYDRYIKFGVVEYQKHHISEDTAFLSEMLYNRVENEPNQNLWGALGESNPKWNFFRREYESYRNFIKIYLLEDGHFYTSTDNAHWAPSTLQPLTEERLQELIKISNLEHDWEEKEYSKTYRI